jgi:hypothetical protein
MSCLCRQIMDVMDCDQADAMKECPALLHRCTDCGREIDPTFDVEDERGRHEC